ncbi:hypothetical protein ABGB12_11690 [Actinocorallia sp. B10E7]
MSGGLEQPAEHDPGEAAREAALDRYGLGRFPADWDRVLLEAVAR